MNKQELIDAIQELADERSERQKYGGVFHNGAVFAYKTAAGLAEQLEEPRKVKVPEEFNEWYKQIKSYWRSESSAKKFALWKICQFGFGKGFEDVNHDATTKTLSNWVMMHKDDAINAIWNGYEVEEEQKWVVKLGKGYFVDFQGRGCLITPYEADGVMLFESENEAERYAGLIGGTVEEARDWNG